ncbi:unnamed protein product [Rotaria sordida]|uniref:Uncharacterized protein n=1 Tax=Rotaria sordida TaxID=392033 RepID=A0A814C654_9BILA|nr:unnamed protein product [Rotaria sordida]
MEMKVLATQNHHSSAATSPTDTTRDITTRRRALDPLGKHHLIKYVRHRRDSIVQHVIGYNYDDNSVVGGLYTRVGIGIFCLGTVIHSSLSILTNLENSPCIRWTAVMDDFSRLLFTFIQFFFIFKHSNLIIRAHESLARLAVMHIVVANLCVCLMCLTLFFLIWENIGETFIHKISDKESTKNVFMVNCHASIKGLFVGMIVFSFTLISTLLYAMFRNKIGDTTHLTSSSSADMNHNHLHKFVEGTVHALFILLALRKRLKRSPKHKYPAREMITLLIMLDLSLWFEKTTTTTKHEANPFQLAFYHVVPWSIIAAIATPLQIFFRFHASVCLSHVWANMYNLPQYPSASVREF